MDRLRAAAGLLLLLLLALGSGLLLAEGTLALFLPRLGRPVTQVVRVLPAGEKDYDFYAKKVTLVPGDLGYIHDRAHPGYTEFGLVGKGTPARRNRPDEYRVLFLGDSVFENAELFDGGVPQVVGRALSANPSGRPVAVLNAGHSGYGTVHELAWLEAFGREVEPDLVILGFVNNDFASPEVWERRSGELTITYTTPEPVPLLLDCGAWNPFLLTRMRSVPLLFRSLAPPLVRFGLIAEPPLFDVGEAENLARLDALHRLTRKLSARLVIVHFPYGADPAVYPTLPEARLHPLLARFSAGRGIPYLDLLPVFQTRDFRTLFVEEEWRGDGPVVHPNETGHLLAAGEIARFLERERIVPFPFDPQAATAPPAGAAAYTPGGEEPPPGAGERPTLLTLRVGGTPLHLAVLDSDRAPDGSIDRAELLYPATLRVGTLPLRLRRGMIFLHPSGELKSGTLAETVEVRLDAPHGPTALLLPGGEPADFHPDGRPMAGRLVEPLPLTRSGSPDTAPERVLPAGERVILDARGDPVNFLDGEPLFLRSIDTSEGRVTFPAHGYTGVIPGDPSTGSPPYLMRITDDTGEVGGRPLAFPALRWIEVRHPGK